MTDEVQGQTHRAAGTLRQWADDLDGLAQNAPVDSPARSLVEQAAGGGYRAADYLDKNGVGGMVQELQEFARRRPGAFLGGAALTGLVVGRLAKAGSKAGQSSQPPSASQSPQPPTGQAPPRAEGILPEGAVRPELPGYPEV